MRDCIDLTILMDCSGSMQSIRHDMEGALAKLIEDQKKFDDVVVSFYRFNNPEMYEEVFVGKLVRDVDKLELNPAGMTALIDAWCRTIDKTGERLAAIPESDRPSKVLFVVITDGEENSSREFTKAQFQERIKRQEEQYNWKFDYLGANQVASDVAHSYGVTNGRTMSYKPSASGVCKMLNALDCSLVMLRKGTYAPEDVS